MTEKIILSKVFSNGMNTNSNNAVKLNENYKTEADPKHTILSQENVKIENKVLVLEPNTGRIIDIEKEKVTSSNKNDYVLKPGLLKNNPFLKKNDEEKQRIKLSNENPNKIVFNKENPDFIKTKTSTINKPEIQINPTVTNTIIKTSAVIKNVENLSSEKQPNKTNINLRKEQVNKDNQIKPSEIIQSKTTPREELEKKKDFIFKQNRLNTNPLNKDENKFIYNPITNQKDFKSKLEGLQNGFTTSKNIMMNGPFRMLGLEKKVEIVTENPNRQKSNTQVNKNGNVADDIDEIIINKQVRPTRVHKKTITKF